MARPLFVLLLLGIIVQLCSGAIYSLSVDALSGQDVPLCVTEPGGDGTSVTTNTSCRTIKYALSPLTPTDFLELKLLAGIYSGPDNINQELNVIEATVLGIDKVIIDCENRGRALTIRDATGNIPHSIKGVEFRNCVGASGGAITIAQRLQRLNIDNCTFNNNHASQSGGAIYGSTTAASSLVISNCIFKNNSAVVNGGAIASEGQSLRVDGSVFERNSAVAGGAIYGSNIGSKEGISRFQNNRFTNNSVSTGNGGGAFFATSTEERTYSFLGSIIDNNCASSGVYTNSYDVQVRCASDVNCTISDRGNATGCLSTYVPPDASSDEDKKISNRDRAIIIGVVVPFAVIAVIAIALFFYIRKKHVKEMGKRDDYRKKILRALENMPPEEQEAARRDAENADPSRPKCQLCQTRPINSPLPCGHDIVCSVCRTILLECPVKGCRKSTR